MDANKPSRNWFHIPVQIAVAAFCVYWLWHVPAPNKAVLCLGGVAAIMVLVEMRPVHKAIYFLLIIGLMFTENRAIDKDRADFARDEAGRRNEENQQFSNIGSTITDNVQSLLDHSNRQFAETMEKVNRTLATSEQTLGNTAGGYGYPYFIALAPNPSLSSDPKAWTLLAQSSERVLPLLHVAASIRQAYDQTASDEEIESKIRNRVGIDVGTLFPRGVVIRSYALPDMGDYVIDISTNHGLFRENLHIHPDPEGFLGFAESYEVYRQTKDGKVDGKLLAKCCSQSKN
jgi:hypothetical protein